MLVSYASMLGRYTRTEVKAAVFGVALCALFFITVGLSIIMSGPIIMGSELNPNGTVEYLCLGSGCENLMQMNW